jgi:hypothetical protein
MDSELSNEAQSLLGGLSKTYHAVLVDGEGGRLRFDSTKWKSRYEPDYVLEVILACLSMVNLVCERVLDQELQHSDGDCMADYDMGYRLFEDCSGVIYTLNELDLPIRSSLLTELFYSHVQYFNISNSAGRQGWYDVNKRLQGSISLLIQLQPGLIDLVEEWGQDIEDLDSESLIYASPEEIWKAEFINSLNRKDV